MDAYLESSEYIDWKHPWLMAKAAGLAAGCVSDEDTAKRCFNMATYRI